ncbi:MULTISPECIES: tetratricopeptide repeat protein [Vibrio]|uniref:Sel1 repeat family protein n=1 Tax=Vibrio halioticoli NBRC 102217 TaxID=1219072 RepID=V5F5F4_9VIBR|nr:MULTISPECIES: sel1 repeat family protein [Vibrio]MPW36053.1 sel1 repeat family protein [Vibrio sp. B1Z05]GAD90784.1 hypothetical protein VHA01S_056_00010 [Vibrio halioticoli NBRC 102217]
MLTVTEMMASGIAILLFMAMFLSIARWSTKRSERAEQRRLEAEDQAKQLEAERVRVHKEKIALADNGHLTTQLELAEMNEAKHPKEAVYWYERAAEQDSIDGIKGILRVCEQYSDELITQDKHRYWQNAFDAHNGDEQAEYEQGIALFEGFGIASNMDKGIQLIEHAANKRCFRAQMFLAQWYRSSENPMADNEKAKMWESRAERINLDGESK